MRAGALRPVSLSVAAAVAALALAACKPPQQTVAIPQCGQETGPEPAAGPAADPGQVRVGTFNVLHGLDDEAHRTLEARVELVADAVAASGIDVLGAQEVGITPGASSGPQQLVARRLAALLSTKTGTAWWWCWLQSNPHWPGESDSTAGGRGGPLSELMARLVRPGEEFREGLAVISRFPVVDAGAARLDARWSELPACSGPDATECAQTALFDTRSLLWTRVDAGGSMLDVATTHLAHHLTERSDAVKEAQLRTALAALDSFSSPDPTPDVLVGDFNSLEGSPVHELALHAGFLDTFRVANPSAPGPTSDQDIRAPVSTVTDRIDYVFARAGSCALTVQESLSLGDEPAPFEDGVLWPSDHHGVQSLLAFTDCDG